MFYRIMRSYDVLYIYAWILFAMLTIVNYDVIHSTFKIIRRKRRSVNYSYNFTIQKIKNKYIYSYFNNVIRVKNKFHDAG